MKQIKRRLTALLLLFTFMTCLFSCQREFSLRLMITGENGCSVGGDAVREVPYGSSPQFDISMPEGQTVIQVLSNGVSISDYVYSDGVLTLCNVTSPRTVRVVAGEASKTCVLFAEPSSTYGGRVRMSVSDGRVPIGTIVTMVADPRDQAEFIGWTVRKTVAEGGEIISKDEQLTVSAQKNILYYANFDDSKVERPPAPVKPTVPASAAKPSAPASAASSSKKSVELLYHLNGADKIGDSDVFSVMFGLDYFQMPNTLPENGKFVREGYVLLGYTLDPKGKGELIGMGHKFNAGPNPESVELYCVWQKAEPEESFTTEAYGQNTLTLTGYTGSADKLYIPRTIGGKDVITIAAGCFNGAGMTEVYIPPTVRIVESGAFSNCEKLSTVTMFDDIIELTDAAFSGTTVHTIKINAAGFPRYATSNECFPRKYERLVCNVASDRIIAVAGSSKHYGINSDYAEKVLGGEYTVVNFGTNAQMNLVFFLEAISKLTHSGDIVVYAPEQYAPYTYWTNGNPEMTALTYQAMESSYNLMSLVDVSNYTNVFTAFGSFNRTRSSMKELTYEQHGRYVDSYGDCSVPRANLNSDTYHNGANGVFKFVAGIIDPAFLVNANRALEAVTASGATACFSFPPYNRNAVDPYCLNEESYDTYNNDLSETVSAQLISDVRDYIYEGRFFSNTDYHVNDTGMKMHTDQLIEDLVNAGLVTLPENTEE